MTEHRNFVPIWEQWAAQQEANLRPAQPSLAPWECRYCGQPLIIEAIGPSADGQRTLTLWHCDGCEVSGVTPDCLRSPPAGVTPDHDHVCLLFPPEEEPFRPTEAVQGSQEDITPPSPAEQAELFREE